MVYDMSEEARQARRAAAYAAAAANRGVPGQYNGNKYQTMAAANKAAQEAAPLAGAPTYTYLNVLPVQDQRDAGAASIAQYVHDSYRWTDRTGTEQILSVNDVGYTKMTQEDAVNQFNELPWYQRDIFARAAEALGGGNRNAQSTYASYVERSGLASRKGLNMDPYHILLEDIASGAMPKWLLHGEDDPDYMGGGGGGGGGFGGGGGAGGDRIDLMNEQDARAVVNSLANQMLGRTVSDSEFKKYYDSILELQKTNPSSIEVGDDGTVTAQQAIGSEGLKYNLEEQMRQTGDFVDTAIGTQGLALLEQFIQKRSI
jgi:hypothetical protein